MGAYRVSSPKFIRTPPLPPAFYAKRRPAGAPSWTPDKWNAKVAREKKRAEQDADEWIAQVRARKKTP